MLSSVVEQEFMVAKKSPFDPKIFLSVVGKGKTVSEYRKDQVIFAQGDVADSIYYLQRGRVKVVVLSEQGKEAVVGLIEAGQFFGEGCMNGQELRIATTTTMFRASSRYSQVVRSIP